jgi:hypothetical protein
MKKVLLSALVLASFAALSAAPSISSADENRSTHLGAQDGTGILVTWTLHQDFNQSQGTSSDTAQSVTIRVFNQAQPGARAVVVNNCHGIDGSYSQNVFQCNLGPNPEQQGESSCTIANIFVASGTESMGMTTTCTQQVAIVMQDNNWLVDPVNGSHDFNISLQ